MEEKKQRQLFFEALYRQTEKSINLRAIKSSEVPSSSFVLDANDVERFIKKYSDRDIYYGVCTREKGDGTKEGCREITSLWCDIDGKDFNGGLEEITKKIKSFPLKPSAVISSGSENSFHLYWFLKEPEEASKEIESYLKGIANALHGDMAATDLSRIMRVPGTKNYKNGKAKSVVLKRIDENLRYNLIDFDDFYLIQDEKQPHKGNKSSVKDLYKGVDEGSRNASLARLVGVWLKHDMTHQECFAEGLRVNERNKPPLSESEVRSIVDSIYKKDQQSKDITVQQPESWSKPIPLDSYSNLPEFPVHVLPSPGREIVEAIAEVNQVPIGLPGSILLAVYSACLSKKIEVDLETHKEPVNLYTVSTLKSGERKSSTISALTKPLYTYQKAKEEEMVDEIREARNAFKIKEKRLEMLQKRAAKSDDETERRQLKFEASKVERWLDENPIPKAPIYIADDITTEATGVIMAENDDRLSIISAEGGIFSIMAGMYSGRHVNCEIYLKGHAGDPWSNHRIGRNSKSMDSPALTMCLTVQPSVIKEIGENNQFRGKGLLARPLYSLNASAVGHRMRQDKSLPKELLNEYENHITQLMNIPIERHTLKLSSEAQELWDEFYNDIETEMRQGHSMEFIQDWGSKLPGAVARISGLLHCAKHGMQGFSESISAVIAGGSAAIGIYFKEHAVATFGLMKEDQKLESAKRVLEYIKSHKAVTFKGRDILTNKNAFKGMEEVNDGLEMLIERGYVREMVRKTQSGRGRPEAKVFEINPIIKTP